MPHLCQIVSCHWYFTQAVPPSLDDTLVYAQCFSVRLSPSRKPFLISLLRSSPLIHWKPQVLQVGHFSLQEDSLIIYLYHWFISSLRGQGRVWMEFAHHCGSSYLGDSFMSVARWAWPMWVWILPLPFKPVRPWISHFSPWKLFSILWKWHFCMLKDIVVIAISQIQNVGNYIGQTVT